MELEERKVRTEIALGWRVTYQSILRTPKKHFN